MIILSVLIKGMKMPRGCLECMFKDIGTYGMTQCLLVAGWIEYAGDGYEIPEACPLVEIKTPHGRLIDEIKAYDHIAEQEGGNYVDMDMVDMGLQETPTVIEAEEDQEECEG